MEAEKSRKRQNYSYQSTNDTKNIDLSPNDDQNPENHLKQSHKKQNKKEHQNLSTSSTYILRRLRHRTVDRKKAPDARHFSRIHHYELAIQPRHRQYLQLQQYAKLQRVKTGARTPQRRIFRNYLLRARNRAMNSVSNAITISASVRQHTVNTSRTHTLGNRKVCENPHTASRTDGAPGVRGACRTWNPQLVVPYNCSLVRHIGILRGRMHSFFLSRRGFPEHSLTESPRSEVWTR